MTLEANELIAMANDGQLQPFIMKQKVYSGTRSDTSRSVWVDEGAGIEPLDPRPSQAVRNYSPDGFDWGGPGSSQAQLALAILLDCTDAKTALANYMDFMWEFVATWGYTFRVTGQEIHEWLIEERLK